MLITLSKAKGAIKHKKTDEYLQIKFIKSNFAQIFSKFKTLWQ
jgi:hypothetical protein